MLLLLAMLVAAGGALAALGGCSPACCKGFPGPCITC
jgi:hypothetical protein